MSLNSDLVEKGRKLRICIVEQSNEEAIALIEAVGVNTRLDAMVSPIVLACIHENLPVLRHCFEMGGDPNAVYRPEAENSTSLLSYASRIGNTELVRLLLQHGADPNFRNPEGICVLEELLQGNYDEKEEILKLLLEAGADPNAQMSFNDGQTFREVLKDWGSSLTGIVEGAK